MKYNYLITFRSITYAQKAQQLLEQANIECQLRRTPKELSTRGCGYCLHIPGGAALGAVELLQDRGITFGKVFAMTGGGAEERVL